MTQVKTTQPLRCLRAPLKEWAKLNARLGRTWSSPGIRDLPWWYNERALLSVLVGAIWRTGGNAFEEFSESKLSPTVKGVKRNGRIDLWFETSGSAFRAEVKRREFPIAKIPNQSAAMNALMSRAISDAKLNLADRGMSRRLAIAFAVPYLKKCSDKECRQKVRDFTAGLDDLDCDAVAWVFPRIKQLPHYKGWISPGIVMWVKVVHRS